MVSYSRGAFPKVKDTTLKPHAYITSKQNDLGGKPYEKADSCEYNFDNCCVELKFTDGSMSLLLDDD